MRTCWQPHSLLLKLSPWPSGESSPPPPLNPWVSFDFSFSPGAKLELGGLESQTVQGSLLLTTPHTHLYILDLIKVELIRTERVLRDCDLRRVVS